MSLNNTTADAVATAICSALSISDTNTINVWKTILRQIYSGLKTDIVATVPINTVVTVGSSTTQTGPTSPVNCVIS